MALCEQLSELYTSFVQWLLKVNLQVSVKSWEFVSSRDQTYILQIFQLLDI